MGDLVSQSITSSSIVGIVGDPPIEDIVGVTRKDGMHDIMMMPTNETLQIIEEEQLQCTYRICRSPIQYGDWIGQKRRLSFAATIGSKLDISNDPKFYKDVMNLAQKTEWIQAMQIEYDSLQKNKTWKLATLTSGRYWMKCKWVYKIKTKANGTIERYKARLVAKRFFQEFAMDYEEAFAPAQNLIQ